MDFKLKVYNRNIPSEKLVEDLKRVSEDIGKKALTIEEYRAKGKYSWDMYKNRYGSWRDKLQVFCPLSARACSGSQLMLPIKRGLTVDDLS